MDKILIKNIIKNSIADELEIEIGDYLLKVNDTQINDILDYKYQISDDFITIDILKKDGKEYFYEVEKEISEDLGIEFEYELIDKPRNCANKCIFCFMDQLPDNVRDTLLFKDDDYRLSFFSGNYVTFTNASKRDIQRIIDYHLSPINISIHATNPEVRKMMLNNKNAGKILEYIEMLTSNELDINLQIVLCKNINDGDVLNQTLNDLLKYGEHIVSLSIVPVGLTQYRDDLYELESFEKEDLIKIINQVKPYQDIFQKKYGENKLFLSDEFYLASDSEIPDYKHYEGFPQIENGVGMMADFLNDFKLEYKKCKNYTQDTKIISIACGILAYENILRCSKLIENKVKGLTIQVIPIKNYFFGEKITVTGLITGSDLIKNLKDTNLGNCLIISEVMLKEDKDIFLDDITLEQVKNELNIDIFCIPNNGKDFIKEIIKITK